jgi:protein-disulfide isomerase
VALITVAAIAVGIVVIAAVFLLNSGSGGKAITKPAEPAPAELQDGRSIGRADAPVTLDIWADFQCPGCGVLSRDMEPRLVNQYASTGKVRLTYHDMAFLGEESIVAATAARCAGGQGKFWPYMQYLFANQGGENKGVYNRTLFDGIARDLGLNLDTFGACLADGKARQAVVDETAQGDKLSITSTPTVFVNGTKVDGLSYSVITTAIEAVLSPATPAPSGSPAASIPASATP